jgi:hypothetical protein
MKRAILSVILSIFIAAPAAASGYGYNYNRGYNPWAYGGAFLGGAIVGGLLSRPYYAAPPVYYAPPPVYYAPPPPVYYAPPVSVDPVAPVDAPAGFRWTNIWDNACQCNRAVLVPN